MNRRNRLRRAGLVLALLVLAAIVTGVAASATKTAIPKQLTGKWRRDSWVMTIQSNGRGGISNGWDAGDLEVSRVTAHRLTLFLAAPCTGTGTYRWRVASRQLKLTKIHGGCVAWIPGTWRRTS
jgi:hypothetical protein